MQSRAVLVAVVAFAAQLSPCHADSPVEKVAVVKLFVGVLEQDYRPPEAPNLLKDFFGDYRDPLWDDIEQERTLIAKTKAENESLQQEVEELHGKVAAAERGYLGKQ